MRIISGKFKGKKINQPNDRFTRPLKDLTKESIFNILKHSNLLKIKIERSKILDLFSGVGSFGLECISRECKEVTFIENYPKVIKILQKNISDLNCNHKVKIIEKNIYERNTLNSLKSAFDIIFIDPPFKEKRLNDLIKIIIESKLLKKEGIMIIHRHKKEKFEILKGFKVLKESTYGISKIIFGNKD